MSSFTNKPTVFISIAAYQDPQLVATIESAIDNADFPERISFGIALQYSKSPELPKFNGIRTVSYSPETRPGICRVRYNISSELYQDEDFYLQIDSHYEFAKGWDSTLLQAYDQFCTEYCTKDIIVFPLELYDGQKMISSFKLDMVNEPGKSSLVINPIPVNSRQQATNGHDEIFFGRVGQIFMPKHFIKDVGLDPFSQYSHEIAYFSYRAIMSGYRFIQLHKKVLWENNSLYMEEVWGNDRDLEHRFTSDHYKESSGTWEQLALAYIYNDYSKYMIHNAKITPKDFWEMQGQLKEYLEAKKYFDQVLYSNLQ